MTSASSFDSHLSATAPQQTARRQREQDSMREKLTLVLDTLIVLSLQMVFRVMHLTRRWNN
jgi:hypothetical protein